MSEWKIYSINGVERAQVKQLELHDEWMAECFLTVTVKSANPVSFQIGDYIDYRGERYCINYDPRVLKKARRGTYGEGFIYENIKFVSDPQSKIVGCDFTDIVLDDNQMHYTGLPIFPFYCESVDDLLDRVQACLEELYPGRFILIGLNTVRNSQRGLLVGRQQAFIDAYKQYVDPTGAERTDSYGKTSVAMTVDNITCWEALTKINSEFDLNFIQRGNVVIAGSGGVFTPSTFRYGKGNGLYEIERISEDSQQVITRLKAYGSEDNIPNRYYAELNLQVFAHVESIKANYATSGLHYANFILDLDYYQKYFTERSKSYPGNYDGRGDYNFIVRIQANGITVKGYITMAYNSTRCEAYCEYTGPNPDDDRDETNEQAINAFSEAISQGDIVYFVGGVEKSAFPIANKSYITENLPNNMAMSRLMLPGFPNKSLYDWVKENGGTDYDDTLGLATINGFTGYFSKDKHRPWVQSIKAGDYGIRPGNIYFDGSDDTENIHPTLEGMKYLGNAVDVVVAAEQIIDNGVYGEGNVPNFTITLPNLGFDLAEVFEEGATIDMKDGMCGSRSFKMASRPTKNYNGQWICKVERAKDDSLDLWFPYNDFQIKTGDHYVLTGIKLPDEYVAAASEKLLYATIEALQKNDSTRFTYQPRIDEIWMARQHDTAIAVGETSLHDTLHAGDIFLFADEDLGIDEGIIIDVLTIRERGNENIPTYEVTLRNEKQVNSIRRMIDKAVSDNSVSGAGGYTGKQIQSLVESSGEKSFLSKTKDDTAQGEIVFLSGLWVKAKELFGINAQGDSVLNTLQVNDSLNVSNNVTIGGKLKGLYGYFTSVFANLFQSSNYTGDGVSDTGFRLTNSHNGHSKLTIDEIYVRMKAVFESLEVRERTYTGGDQIWSCAGNQITRVDYLGNVETADHVPQMMNVHADGRPSGQGQGDVYSVPVPGDIYGYSDVKVPWLLRQMPLLARAKVFARYRKVRIVINEPESNSTNRAAASESPLANIRRARCYFLAKDDDMEVHNWWRINDLARCQTMNLANTTRQTYLSGEDEKAGNIFWWRKVIGVSYEPVTLEDGKQYHYFDVSFDYELEKSQPAAMATSVMEGSDIPAAHDSVVQFGNTIIEGRMNLMMMEVNGSDSVGYNPSTDAPCLKAYRGVYCFDLNKSWVGGNARKMMLSPKSGYEFYGPNFKQVTEYDVVPVPIDRGLWPNITPTRDDYREHAMVRKCYYYDKVSHNGSYWLCSIVDGAHWVNGDGDYISDADYAALTEAQKALCSRKQNYTIEEPSANSIDWTEVVQKGDKGSFKSRVFCRTNSTPNTPQSNTPEGTTYNTYNNPVPPPVTGQPTWTDGIPQGTAILWSSVCTFYANGTNSGWSTPAPETDTADLDIEFSPSTSEPSVPQGNIPFADHSSEGWYDPSRLPAGQTMIWRAERKVKNGVYNGDWVITRIYGEKGNSITKSSEVAYYIKNTTGVRPAEDDPNWSTTKPTIGKGEWLFTKTVITWSDNSKTVLYTDERNPNDGIAGQDIIVDGATEMKYYVGTSNTTHPADDSSDWKDLSQVTQEQGKWLWSQAITYYRKADSSAGSHDAGSSINYNVSYISKDGKTGRGIQSITEYYQATNSSAARQNPTSESGWDTDPNLSHLTDKWDANHKYLWNMEKTVYTNVDGSTTTEYTIPQILAIWTKDGNPGRGIDSIQNKYCVTSSSTPPAKEGESGAPTWYNTPQTPGKGQYLWNYEVITWINPSGTTSTDVQMIGYAGQDSTVPGPPGTNAVGVSLSPEEVLVTQSTTSPYNIDLSNAETVVSVNEGGVPKSFTISNVSGTNCNASVKSGTTDTIKISSIGTYNVTVDGETVSRYYDNGYVTFDVTYGGNTYHKRFNFYANLLGTWKETVEAGVKDVVAEVVTYDFLDGKLTKNNRTYTQTASAARNYETWSSEENTQEGSKKWMNQHINTADQNISTIQRNAVTRNLLGRGQWKSSDYLGTLASYEAKNDRWYDDEANDLYSPTISLQKGKYCFYCYVPSNRYFSSKVVMYKLKDGSMIMVYPYDFGVIDNDTVTINGNAYHRCYAQFELNEDINYVINVYGDSVDEADIAVPCLCEGETPSIDTSMSMIRRTAENIEARVNNTGVNISTGEVAVYGGKFSMKPDKNSDATFELDENGNLKSKGNAQFEGKVKATSGEFTGKVTASDGAIGGFEIGPNYLRSADQNHNIVLNSDGSAALKNGNFEVSVDANKYVKITSSGFEAKWGTEGFKIDNSGIQRWDSTRNVWAAMYEKKIPHINKSATTVNLGNLPGVNYVLNARVDEDNHTLVLLPPVSDVPNGTSIIVRGLARDCDATVRVANTDNDAMLIGDYKVTETGILAADCAEFIMCKGINSYIKPSQWSSATLYIQDAWICNYYDRDV